MLASPRRLEHSGGPKRLQEVQVEVFDPVWSGGGVPQILAHERPKRGIFGYQGQKTARRAAEQAPTGNPKISRVTSGLGEYMIPLNQVCLRSKKCVIWA